MIIKIFLVNLLLCISLFGVEIVVDSSLSVSDKRFIDKLLGKKVHSVNMHLNARKQESSDQYIVQETEEPSSVYNGNSYKGKNMFRACAGCHGQRADKKALGKSKVIVNMSTEAIYRALVGYKNRTYGGPMRGIMRGQVAKYNNQELRNVATYISSLR